MTRLCFAVASLLILPHAAIAAGLDDLPSILDRTSHRASSFDLTGGNDDNVSSFAPGAVQVLLDVAGPGRVTHLWLTAARFPNHEFLLRDMVIRMYWEGSPVPSVEVPLGDFFGLGHGRLYAYQSAPMTVGSNPVALNCYWPMPFQRHARIEIVNAGSQSIRRLYYNVDYELGNMPAAQGLFHAMYRRDRGLDGQSCTGNTTGAGNYVILETEGRGQYVGCTLSVDAQPGAWWGEGDDMIFIDGATTPTIIGTGSEDYFCNAWGYKEPFSYPYYGASLLQDLPDGAKLATVYRWHIPDPVRFSKQIRVTIEHCWDAGVLNDFTSVAYWYQAEPIRTRPALPPAAENQPGRLVAYVVDATQLEPDCLARGIKARSMTTSPAEATGGGWLRVETAGRPVELHVPAPGPGRWALQVKPANRTVTTAMKIALKGGLAHQFRKAIPTAARSEVLEADVPYVDLGVADVTNGYIAVWVSGEAVIGLDGFKFVPPQAAVKGSSVASSQPPPP